MVHITIIDTGICNITSVENAFSRIGCTVNSTNSVSDALEASFLVLPGVGAFEEGMGALHNLGLVNTIKEKVLEEKTPIIGICLGMQMLADTSDEHGMHEGLGIISGKVVKLEANDSNYKIPNIGWHNIISDKQCIMFDDESNADSFYLVHSYHMECTHQNDVAAHIEFSGRKVTVAVEKDNVFGMQFHPEKSQDDGLNLLSRVVNTVANK